MLLIHCPYCEQDLPELEFAYAGEAHIARPADPSSADRRGMARLPLHPHQPPRPPLRALAPHQRLRPLLQRGARDRLRPVPAHLQGGRAPPRHRQPDGSARMTSYRLPDRGRVDHGRPVRFSFDGKTYTGPRRRHARLGAARQRRPPDGPLVQVPPPARRRLRRLRRAERADGHPPRPRPLRAEHPRHHPGAARRPRGRRARTAGPRSPSTSGAINDSLGIAVLGRLLLQDLHVAARLLGPGLRAGHPQRRRPRRLADRARRRPLRQPLRPCRRAGRRRRPRRPRRRARRRPLRRQGHARRRDRRARRHAPLRARRSSSTASPPGTGSPRPSPSSPRCRTSPS